jgi:Zn/Cd-binding protein ZinT
MHTVQVGKAEGKSHSEDLDVDGRKILKWISSKLGVRFLIGSG